MGMLLCAVAPTARAQLGGSGVQFLLDVPGITGDSVVQGSVGWITLEGFDLDLSRDGDGDPDQNPPISGVSELVIPRVTFVKQATEASESLTAKFRNRARLDDSDPVVFKACRFDAQTECFITLELEGYVLITNLRQWTSNIHDPILGQGNNPVLFEEYTVQCQMLTVTYTPIGGGTPDVFTYEYAPPIGWPPP